MKIEFIERIKNKIGLTINPPIHKGKNMDYIFIHINKTAGTSINKIIGKPYRKHLTAKQIIDQIGKNKWQKAYKFTVVRNPWDKVVSHYKYRLKTNQSNIKNDGLSFKEWVLFTYGENKDPKYYNKPQMFLPQVEWLKDYHGKINIDKIVKFENLKEGISEVFSLLGIDEQLPHLNKTNKTNYKDFYDQETKKIIADWFQEDIKLFDYFF